jgi:Kef-type K+ transport system membrane component KefB
VCLLLLALFFVLLGSMLDCDWIIEYVAPILVSTAIMSTIIAVFIRMTQAPKSELSDCDTYYRVKVERYE